MSERLNTYRIRLRSSNGGAIGSLARRVDSECTNSDDFCVGEIESSLGGRECRVSVDVLDSEKRTTGIK
jgi:hypothetical protein